VLFIWSQFPKDVGLNSCYEDYNKLVFDTYYNCFCTNFETNRSYKTNKYVFVPMEDIKNVRR